MGENFKIVVITGCLGLIGSHVTRECLARGWKVYGIDKCTYAANTEYIEEFSQNKNFKFVKEDIATLKYLPDCDYVINLAAESHVGNSIIDSADFIHSNVVGVKNLLDLIRLKPRNVDAMPVFFHFSTDEVYGDVERGFHDEQDILKPSNPYSASKAAADMLIMAWARTYDLKYIILRPTNNYGKGQFPEKLIPVTIKHLMRGKKVRLHDGGEPIRNWLHSSDTATAVTAIIESGKTNEIYNVAGGFEQQNIETFKKIVEAYHGQLPENWRDMTDLTYAREGQDVRYALNDDKLRAIGWEPKKNFDNEITNLVKHYRENFKW
jgi:dTDP-glucose 4,6-dehydratase